MSSGLKFRFGTKRPSEIKRDDVARFCRLLAFFRFHSPSVLYPGVPRGSLRFRATIALFATSRFPFSRKREQSAGEDDGHFRAESMPRSIQRLRRIAEREPSFAADLNPSLRASEMRARVHVRQRDSLARNAA